jgi:glycogen debranching enzyme
MAEKILIGDKWYVAATSARTDEAPQVLKHDRTFLLLDRFGDMQVLGPGEQGLYHDDTRFLSYQQLSIDGARPLFLGSTVKEANSLLVVELMNPDLTRNGAVAVPKGTLHIFRAKLLWQGACYEHLRLTNHGSETVAVQIRFDFDADFVDLFEVRGMKRARRGERLVPQVGADEVTLRYKGLDSTLRHALIRFAPVPGTLDERHAAFDLQLPPGSETHLYCTVLCACEGDTLPALTHYDVALQGSSLLRGEAADRCCTLQTSNPLVNLWLDRSASDLAMLSTALPTGPFPYAGVPWYSTTFGRDGLLTARECLWKDPAMARGVLALLAATQAKTEEPVRDAEPGKILHEARFSEMARTGEIPFGRYYGTVDATPLFVALAGAYAQRTGDLDFIRSIWHNVLDALKWIDTFGDPDGDGFVEYARRSAEGLLQQGWKDSYDSIFHADGALAEAPIALCEVQAYVFEAKSLIAAVARRLGDHALGGRLEAEAKALRQRFNEVFWCEEIGTYAIALDGRKQPCKVSSSNAGHALWTGIAWPQYAQRVIAGFAASDFFSGWGVRTIPTGRARYNPMSYHNGSVWPHDNAIVAAGMARYGGTREAMAVMSGMFDASLHFSSHRLPELFCGFARRAGEGPTLYPVACAPQAWASAAAFSLLQSCLGLALDADAKRVSLHTPRLPPFIQWLKIAGLPVGDSKVDLLLQRYENNVGVEVTGKIGDVDVVVVV